jgi:hypothetical protein
MAPGTAIRDAVFARVAELNASLVRYLHWDPFPALSYPAPTPPRLLPGGAGCETSWNFSLLDPMVTAFMEASGCGEKEEGCVFNFSLLPAWLLDGNGPRDHTGAEAGDYFSRIVSWYTKGGFVDECGANHSSTHAFEWKVWEVLNEVDYGSPIQCPSPSLLACAANYTRVYDGIARALRRDHPTLRFSALALALEPETEDFWFEYFLDPAKPRPGLQAPGVGQLPLLRHAHGRGGPGVLGGAGPRIGGCVARTRRRAAGACGAPVAVLARQRQRGGLHPAGRLLSLPPPRPRRGGDRRGEWGGW